MSVIVSCGNAGGLGNLRNSGSAELGFGVVFHTELLSNIQGEVLQIGPNQCCPQCAPRTPGSCHHEGKIHEVSIRSKVHLWVADRRKPTVKSQMLTDGFFTRSFV